MTDIPVAKRRNQTRRRWNNRTHKQWNQFISVVQQRPQSLNKLPHAAYRPRCLTNKTTNKRSRTHGSGVYRGWEWWRMYWVEWKTRNAKPAKKSREDRSPATGRRRNPVVSGHEKHVSERSIFQGFPLNSVNLKLLPSTQTKKRKKDEKITNKCETCTYNTKKLLNKKITLNQ